LATAWAWRSTRLPILAPGFDQPLEEGNVVAIEPKFVFPGRGAVGIENMYAVTASGFETLTTAPEDTSSAEGHARFDVP